MPLSRLVLALLVASSSAWAETGPGEPHLAPLRAKLTFENVGMPLPGETLGLIGLNIVHDFRCGAYLGLTSYGAVTGKRGGFITAGLTTGFRVPLGARIKLDAGFHVGGGGAGRAAVGGGLMVRTHAGLEGRAAGLTWGAEVARVRFPNGRIDSTEVALSLGLPFRAWLSDGSRREVSALLPGNGLGEATLAMNTQRYQPLEGARLLTGPKDTNPIELVGLMATANLAPWSFLSLELAAAGRGKADGYMEIMLGLGARMNLTPDGALRGYVRASAGPAGGGNLDVGGGMAYRAAAGLEGRLAGLVMGAEIGHLTTPSATFRATTYQISLGQTFSYARPGGRPLSASDRLVGTAWRLRAGVLRLRAPQRRRGAAPDPINLVGVQVDNFINEHLYLTGEGLFGTNGNAGGFAMGTLGAGVRTGRLMGQGPRAFLELQFGAAGGGGVDTGGGAVTMPLLGVEQELGRGLTLILKGGRATTRKGALDTDALELALGYRFGLLERR